MRAKKKLFLVTTVVMLAFVGCKTINEQAKDPNSPLSNTVTAVDAVANAVKEVAPAAGPYGWIAGLAATIVASATGVYKVAQKNKTIEMDSKIVTAQQKEMQMVTAVTRSIIAAIENVGNAPVGVDVSRTVKDEVAKQLEDNKIAAMGKAIISGLKAENDLAQKSS